MKSPLKTLCMGIGWGVAIWMFRLPLPLTTVTKKRHSQLRKVSSDRKCLHVTLDLLICVCICFRAKELSVLRELVVYKILFSV